MGGENIVVSILAQPEGRALLPAFSGRFLPGLIAPSRANQLKIRLPTTEVMADFG
jgi:hypothetical protein